MITKLLHLIKMKSNALYYGVPFTRRSTFKIPEKINDIHKLVFPDEHGAKCDFLGVFVEDTYRLRSIKSKINKIIDVGANVGFFSIAAKLNFSGSEIHAYEPFKELSTYLEPNSHEFPFKVFYEAVGGHEGPVSLQISGDSNQTRVTERDDAQIKKISIDQAIEKIGGIVDLLKIDCEGSEWEMFAEGNRWHEVARIAMEYHNFSGQPHTQILDELTRIGFTVIDQQFDPKVNFGMVYAINELLVKSWK